MVLEAANRVSALRRNSDALPYFLSGYLVLVTPANTDAYALFAIRDRIRIANKKMPAPYID